MVRDDEKRASWRNALPPFDGESPSCIVNDPRGAVTDASNAERPVVPDEAAGDVVRDRPHKPAEHLDSQAGLAADKRLGALPRHDLRDPAALPGGWGGPW